MEEDTDFIKIKVIPNYDHKKNTLRTHINYFDLTDKMSYLLKAQNMIFEILDKKTKYSKEEKKLLRLIDAFSKTKNYLFLNEARNTLRILLTKNK